jgi:hypothetical protein
MARRCHVLTEYDLVPIGTEQISHRTPGASDNSIRLDRGCERTPKVAAATFHEIRHGLNHGFVDLGATGPIEVRNLPSVLGSSKGGETGPDGVSVEIHTTSIGIRRNRAKPEAPRPRSST